MQVQTTHYHVTLADTSVYKYSDFEDTLKRWHTLKGQFCTLSFTKAFIAEEPRADSTDHSYRLLTIDTDKFVLTQEELVELAVSGIQYKVNRTITTNVDISQQLMDLAHKPIKLVTEQGNQYNTKCEVHMPGQALSFYNEVQLLEDSCTDVLQTSLNSGWRIIAACPQPDQRRPDYILGRFNPDYEAENLAKR